MNYIYDVLLNFQKDFYDFYEWNEDDEIIHIRKMPLFYISNKDYNIIKNSTVCFNKDFCDKIHNRTEKFKKINVALLNYVFLISNGKETMALKLNKNGVTTHKSSLLLDENEEISEMAEDLKLYNLEYKIIKSNDISFNTRYEKENIVDISNKLCFLYNHKEDDKLKFLYLECFGKVEDDVNKVFNKLQKEIKSNNKVTLKMIDFFKLINQK